ncbi:50S ribosomal protein L23 [Desulfotomaculum varum]|uniref:Large ribosomal subunit protein uL23 n=1 Tax=Desulforamulus hydrothermalis Lam5 = DSM 18033 TaxID=1121428 RepID=K8EGM4_9FIRM|nr:50S ribosomal protein L23 [Desulforamulus hydrothermalis]CCO07801.1 50S ribosomal protein L23 [Desulforamulus hydrothermalis Lam5 = DSM 18033]SHH26496.1 large subunit ribosomal protein L23 [Desulforamulus hydrothermalis Lam5 = DSM 18033]
MKNPRDILIKPVVTEKSTRLLADNKYTFIVDLKANKTEIKQAVEDIFKVKVEKVNTMRVKGKLKRVRQFIGRTPERKKAIVTLREGDKIEIFEGL